jgi:subtilisin family serine protease
MGSRVQLESLAPGLLAVARELAVQAIDAPYEDVFQGAPIEGPGDGPEARLRRSLRLVLPAGADARTAARRLAQAPGVEGAEPDAVFHLAWTAGAGFFPDDPLFTDGTQWGLWNTGSGPSGGVAGVDIRAPLGWAITTGSTATILGIVDTGFDLHHPELAGVLADGSPRVIRAFNSSIEGPAGAPDDSVGHGTIVAGVAFARSNNGVVLGSGIAGVSGGSGGDSAGCRIVEVKATPTRLTDALGSELARGIAYAVVAGARAINLSFGGDEDNSDVRDAMSFAQRRGCVVICGAGNGQDERPQYPGYYARYGNGVSVAAIKSDGTLARFSSRGPQIDVAAPGEDIMSTFLTYPNAYDSPLRNYAASSGTSFAAPFVTGLAGLAFTVQPDMIDNEFQAVLRRTARDIGAPGRDDVYGWGIPDAPALLTALLPPHAFQRGTVSAQTWSKVATDSVTLSQTRIAVNGCSIDGRYIAERWEVRAHVSLPPGLLLETPQVIVRAHGTNGQGGWPNATLLEYDGSTSARRFPAR